MFTQHDGKGLLSGPEAMLKGVLEAEIEVALLTGPRRGGFANLFNVDRQTGGPGAESPVAQALRQHGTRMAPTPDAHRAVVLAGQAARAGRAAFAFVPNDELDRSIAAILEHKSTGTGAMVLVLEDAPSAAPASCPRRAAERLNIPCIEPADIEQLRDSMEHALRLSKAARTPCALVVHDWILRSCDTIQLRPNRVLGSVEQILARPRRTRLSRSLRWADAGPTRSPLRIARRLELNLFRATPSPGERVTVGFITVGPTDASLRHITNVLGLHGRVPVLQLGLIRPLDESAVNRMLARCQNVIVLEPRPGMVEISVLAVAEAMRRRQEHPATIWGREIPQTQEALAPARKSQDIQTGVARETDPAWSAEIIAADLHPSMLVRRIAHLLHGIRPTMQVAAQLAETPPLPDLSMPAREHMTGAIAALAEFKRVLTDVDQWLRERAPLQERGLERSTLAIDGAAVRGFTGRIVHVETWEHHAFEQHGVTAIVQASRELQRAGGSRIMLVCEMPGDPDVGAGVHDLERLARGAIPAEAVDRVDLATTNFADSASLREAIRDATLVDRLSIIIVRDGPPATFDAAALERALTEIDRLGFEPRQRLVRDAGEICGWGGTAKTEEPEQRLIAATHEQEASSLKNDYSIEPVTHSATAKFYVRVRPLLEELEVVRTRPPLRAWQSVAGERLASPTPLHARASQWRAHLAGFRSEPPGLAALVLCEAGRAMGYHVKCIHQPVPIGGGRRAWAQVLFTQSPGVESDVPLSASIPYGEADLLLGLDETETIRSIGGDPGLHVANSARTYAVAQVRLGSDELDRESAALLRQRVISAVSGVSRDDVRMLNDFAVACRTWFHTERVADMAMLGAAFQLGLIPLAPEAIESALNLVQARGYGRSREVFEFGRRLAIDDRLFQRVKDEREEDVMRLGRRMVLSLSRGAWGGGARARNFSELLRSSLDAMPGLAETEPGREARRDFVMACHRCRVWGGFVLAQQYVDRITRLYQSDRADTGRALTRHAVLPLADAMLIRDPLYVAGMATSPEQRRRTRQRMNVKAARGDRIERRYLTRLELIAFGRRYRADVRTSDWPARVASLLRRAVPQRWRGTRRERELRDFILDFVQRAADLAQSNYDLWLERMKRLHHHAAEDRLRGMALAEVKMLVGENV